MTTFNHFVGTECFKLKHLVFYFCALSIPLGDICNPIFARMPVPLAGRSPVLSLAKAVIVMANAY